MAFNILKIVCRIQKQRMGLASLMSRDVCFWTIPHFFLQVYFVHNNTMNSGSLSNFLNSIQAQTEANYSLNYRHSEHEALKPNFWLLCQFIYDLSHEFDYPYLNIQNSKCYYWPQNYSSWWKLLHFEKNYLLQCSGKKKTSQMYLPIFPKERGETRSVMLYW